MMGDQKVTPEGVLSCVEPIYIAATPRRVAQLGHSLNAHSYDVRTYPGCWLRPDKYAGWSKNVCRQIFPIAVSQAGTIRLAFFSTIAPPCANLEGVLTACGPRFL